MSKRLGRIIGFKYKTSSWHLNGFPYGSNNGSTVVVVVVGCEDKATTWYLNGFPDGSNLESTVAVVVFVVSHIQRIGCQPGKNYFTRWPIPLVVC